MVYGIIYSYLRITVQYSTVSTVLTHFYFLKLDLVGWSIGKCHVVDWALGMKTSSLGAVCAW